MDAKSGFLCCCHMFSSLVPPWHTHTKPQISSDPHSKPSAWPLPLRAICAFCMTSSPHTPFSCRVWGWRAPGSCFPGTQFHWLGGRDQSPSSAMPCTCLETLSHRPAPQLCPSQHSAAPRLCPRTTPARMTASEHPHTCQQAPRQPSPLSLARIPVSSPGPLQQCPSEPGSVLLRCSQHQRS